MNLLIFFSVVFATIVFAIVLERLIHCPILVGFSFFAIFLIVAAVLNSTILVIAAIGLGILAFIVAFLDCIFRNSGFLRNNSCLTCNRDDDNDVNNQSGRIRNCNCNCNCNCGDSSDNTLTILNNDGRVIARINGNNITCNDDTNGCGCGSGRNNLEIGVLSEENNSSNCGCDSRYSKLRRY